MDAENPEPTTPQASRRRRTRSPAAPRPGLDLAIAQLEHRKIAMPERIELLAVEARLAHLA